METSQPRIKTTKSLLFMLLIALLTALGGEIKIIPFENVPFRFGLGSVIFFFALLVYSLPILWTGIFTALFVIIERSFLDVLLHNASFSTQVIEHLPAGLFYLTYALCFKFIQLDDLKKQPILLGLCGTAFEVISNTLEHVTTELLLATEQETFSSLLIFIIVGLLRSFFVVGVYSMITLSEQKKQLQQLMAIHSELYVETLYIQKSMNQVEQLTANSYQLYKKLMPLDSALSKEALTIAQEIHEIKKDHERIYAGLAKITDTEYKTHFYLSDLLSFIVEANENYANHLKKNISFTLICPDDFITKEHIALLAVLNNIMANAVEAIPKQGFITLSVLIQENITNFVIEDNGVGIEPTLLPIIFDVGYTSKFNEQGQASTGIGLSHTKTIIENLEGTITVASDNTTCFVINIPTINLRKGF
ncbi:sensor histidine kinase [Solibacillus sp. MA9]|uniref:Sensor histidine kinase n=1 Tax=Solibacillus palustris TaxID=2908203 RepID=A0ABS9UIF7_9BACL|nr:sensor histidine kinase [Solibacillus sp. MA9]MCH7324043.1 sensor histidine kinase [Solibacillus sp. MA9]